MHHIQLLRFLSGIITALLFLIVYITLSITMVICFGIVQLIPFRKTRSYTQHLCMFLFPFSWRCLYVICQAFKLWRWHPPQQAQLKPNGWYLVIANHSSWLDILIAGIFFSFKIPALKFFLKKELRWGLPISGIACHLAGFPFLDRKQTKRSKNKRSREKTPKDIQTAQNTCHKLLENPSTLIIFPEGTRFSCDKQQLQKSPYSRLLKPKSTGIGTIINEMHTKLDGIIDLTLDYTPEKVSVWGFLCGKLKYINISYRVIPITSELLGEYSTDREYRRRLQAWLNEVWAKKDATLKGWRNE